MDLSCLRNSRLSFVSLRENDFESRLLISKEKSEYCSFISIALLNQQSLDVKIFEDTLDANICQFVKDNATTNTQTFPGKLCQFLKNFIANGVQANGDFAHICAAIVLQCHGLLYVAYNTAEYCAFMVDDDPELGRHYVKSINLSSTSTASVCVKCLPVTPSSHKYLWLGQRWLLESVPPEAITHLIHVCDEETYHEIVNNLDRKTTFAYDPAETVLKFLQSRCPNSLNDLDFLVLQFDQLSSTAFLEERQATQTRLMQLFPEAKFFHDKHPSPTSKSQSLSNRKGFFFQFLCESMLEKSEDGSHAQLIYKGARPLLCCNSTSNGHNLQQPPVQNGASKSAANPATCPRSSSSPVRIVKSNTGDNSTELSVNLNHRSTRQEPSESSVIRMSSAVSAPAHCPRLRLFDMSSRSVAEPTSSATIATEDSSLAPTDVPPAQMPSPTRKRGRPPKCAAKHISEVVPTKKAKTSSAISLVKSNEMPPAGSATQREVVSGSVVVKQEPPSNNVMNTEVKRPVTVSIVRLNSNLTTQRASASSSLRVSASSSSLAAVSSSASLFKCPEWFPAPLFQELKNELEYKNIPLLDGIRPNYFEPLLRYMQDKGKCKNRQQVSSFVCDIGHKRLGDVLASLPLIPIVQAAVPQTRTFDIFHALWNILVKNYLKRNPLFLTDAQLQLFVTSNRDTIQEVVTKQFGGGDGESAVTSNMPKCTASDIAKLFLNSTRLQTVIRQYNIGANVWLRFEQYFHANNITTTIGVSAFLMSLGEDVLVEILRSSRFFMRLQLAFFKDQAVKAVLNKLFLFDHEWLKFFRLCGAKGIYTSVTSANDFDKLLLSQLDTVKQLLLSTVNVSGAGTSSSAK